MTGRFERPSRRSRGEAGIVGVHLVLVVAFAFFAVTMLTRTTLAARQIEDNVRVIVTEVGPGSNVSRLEETQTLDSVGATAEEILAVPRPLSRQAGEIVTSARSIDNTLSGLNGNTHEINAAVRSINAIASELLPVADAIRGRGEDATGVAGIDVRADSVLPAVAGISTDLGSIAGAVGGEGRGGLDADAGTIDGHVASIDCALRQPSAGLLGALGGLLNSPLASAGPAAADCGRR